MNKLPKVLVLIVLCSGFESLHALTPEAIKKEQRWYSLGVGLLAGSVAACLTANQGKGPATFYSLAAATIVGGACWLGLPEVRKRQLPENLFKSTSQRLERLKKGDWIFFEKNGLNFTWYSSDANFEKFKAYIRLHTIAEMHSFWYAVKHFFAPNLTIVDPVVYRNVAERVIGRAQSLYKKLSVLESNYKSVIDDQMVPDRNKENQIGFLETTLSKSHGDPAGKAALEQKIENLKNQLNESVFNKATQALNSLRSDVMKTLLVNIKQAQAKKAHFLDQTHEWQPPKDSVKRKAPALKR